MKTEIEIEIEMKNEDSRYKIQDGRITERADYYYCTLFNNNSVAFFKYPTSCFVVYWVGLIFYCLRYKR